MSHDTVRESGGRLVACLLTADVFGYGPDDFIDGVEFAGATAFRADARRAHVTMFIQEGSWTSPKTASSTRVTSCARCR